MREIHVYVRVDSSYTSIPRFRYAPDAVSNNRCMQIEMTVYGTKAVSERLYVFELLSDTTNKLSKHLTVVKFEWTNEFPSKLSEFSPCASISDVRETY